LVIRAVGRLGGIRGDERKCGECMIGDVLFGKNWENGRSGVEGFLPGVGI